MSLVIPVFLPAQAKWRRRINANPKVSLAVYKCMKADDFYGFGVTVQELATRLLALALSGTTESYLKGAWK